MTPSRRHAGTRSAPRPDAVAEPAGYLDVLTAAGLAADVWETTYLHVLTGEDPGDTGPAPAERGT